jgi:predicted TPR repeat methyltransferase
MSFTLESRDGDGFIMGERRRYAHSALYVRALIEAAALVVLQFEKQSIRPREACRAS